MSFLRKLCKCANICFIQNSTHWWFWSPPVSLPSPKRRLVWVAMSSAADSSGTDGVHANVRAAGRAARAVDPPEPLEVPDVRAAAGEPCTMLH